MWFARTRKAIEFAKVCMSILALSFTTSVLADDVADDGFFKRTTTRIENVVSKGDWDLYLSGYSYHARRTYSEKRIERLNEKAWGIGFGKTFRNAKENDESLYAMVIKDSHANAQWMAGYAHQWIYPVTDNGLEAGVGLSALFIRRKDWFDGNPFPALLPFTSVGKRDAKLYAVYVPRISTRKGKGDVVLFFGRFSF